MDPNLKAYLDSLPEKARETVKNALRGLVEIDPVDPAIAAARLAAGLPAVAPKPDPIRQAAGLDRKES